MILTRTEYVTTVFYSLLKLHVKNALLIVQCVCVGQMTSCRSLFSPSTVQVLGLKLRWSGLAAGARLARFVPLEQASVPEMPLIGSHFDYSITLHSNVTKPQIMLSYQLWDRFNLIFLLFLPTTPKDCRSLG